MQADRVVNPASEDKLNFTDMMVKGKGPGIESIREQNSYNVLPFRIYLRVLQQQRTGKTLPCIPIPNFDGQHNPLTN
jgi:hypothetical protein